MKFRFIWVGKTRNEHFRALQEDYLQRLSRFVKCEVTEIRDGDGDGRKETEGKRILENVNPNALVCLLDIAGRSVSSHDLAEQIERWQRSSLREIDFVIGGAEGVSYSVAARADDVLSLSFLTFTHEMARVVLVEQLYRGFTIIKGFPYQK
jgi:23S rRNA (pseudouridine1915-N3)-methyltransferase